MRTRHSITLLILIASAAAASAQTLPPRDTSIDLQAQGKNPDFSSFPFTRPVAVGATLPGTCQIGQLLFLTSAPAGSNLYACTAANVWTVESGGTPAPQGATMAAQLGDFAAVLSGSTLTIGSGCSAANPCNARLDNTSFSFHTPATAGVAGESASDLVFIYIDSTGNLTVADSSAPIICTGCTYASGVTQFPANSIPLWTWTVVNGAFTSTGGVDFRAMLSAYPMLGGAGIQLTSSAGVSTIAIDPTSVPALAANNVFTGNNAFQNITVSSCTGCGAAGAAPSAAPPYLVIGGTKYISSDGMYQATMPSLSGWSLVGSDSPAVTTQPNGDITIQGDSGFPAEYSSAHTGSIEAVLRCLPTSPSTNQTSACQIGVYDSTNGVVWLFGPSTYNYGATTSATGMVCNLFQNTWNGSLPSALAYSSNPSTFPAIAGAGSPFHIRIRISGTTANFEVSTNAGESYTALTTETVGTVAGFILSVGNAVADVESLLVQ